MQTHPSASQQNWQKPYQQKRERNRSALWGIVPGSDIYEKSGNKAIDGVEFRVHEDGNDNRSAGALNENAMTSARPIRVSR